MNLYSDLVEVLTPYANKIKGLAASDDQIKADLDDLDDNVNDLKSAVDEVKQAFPYYPIFVRGSGNSNNGAFVPSDRVLNRLIEMEFIPISSFNEVHAENGINFFICYYDDNKEFVSSSGSWKNNYFALDITNAYCRIFLKKSDGSDFASVITDAVYFSNSEKTFISKSEFNKAGQTLATDTNNAIYGLVYSENRSVDAGASNSSRWFINQEFLSGWLHAIKLHNSSQGALTVELWERIGENYTRYASKDAYVYAGENSIEIDTPTRDNTWISFAPSLAGTVRIHHSTGIAESCYIVRDKSSISFTKSSFERQPYRIIADVVLYALPDNYVTQHIYTIGENDNVAAVLTEAMHYPNSIVYIEPYEHDCIAEWEAFYGSNYFTDMSSGRGLVLGNGIHIIGRSGHKLKCWYTGSNDYVMENFSLFNNNSNDIGYTLENVCIDTKKIRYCIHDERSSDIVPYKVKYSRCIMSQDMTGSTWDHSRACIGGGLGSYGDVIVEDCIFSTVTSAQNMDSLAYHNGSGDKCDSSIVIKNCYCTGDSTLQLASYGTSTMKTKVIVANCSFGSPIEIYDWTGGTPNFDIYQINNEIRS